MGSTPVQVRRQAERAEEILKEINQPAVAPEQPAAPEPAPDPQDPPAQPAEAPAQPDPQDPPAPSDAPAEPTEPAPADPAKPTDGEPWEARYRSLQGILAKAERQWAAERQQLQQQLQELQKAHAPAPAPAAPTAPAPAPAAPTKKSRVTEADVEQYGPELLDVIKRQAADLADEIVAQRLAEIKPELEKTRAQVTDVATRVYRNAEEKFYGELTAEVPDWRAINEDPRWLEWLGEVDPLSGVPRQAYLDNAAQTMDHARVARLFTTFKQAAGIAQPATTPAPAKPALSPSPRTVGAASAPTPREPDATVSQAEIAAHYRRSTSDPAYRTSPEYKAMEQRLAVAMASGKIA